MNTKGNRKARLSKEIFRQSLLELMGQKAVYKISVTEVCAHAQMNRSTFYAHYETIWDLLHEIEYDIYEHMRQALQGYTPGNTQTLVRYYQYIYKNGNTFLKLIEQDPDFHLRILTAAINLYPFPQTAASTNCLSKELNLKLNYIAGGSLYAIQQWLTDPNPILPQQMAERMLQFANMILHAS